MQRKLNPLLNINQFVDFANIKPEHITPALDITLKECQINTIKILTQKKPFTWQNLMQPLNIQIEKLHKIWAAIEHLNSVKNSDELRKVYEENLPKITTFFAELSQNKELYQAVKSLKANSIYTKLSIAQKKIITNELRDFKLSGVTLPKAKKPQFIDLQNKLAALTTKFANNVLDATFGFQYKTTSKKHLIGLPENILHAAKKGKAWVFNLDQPTYIAIMTYAESRALRKKFYTAYVTRASKMGPDAGKWDNSKIINDILFYRKKLSEMLKFYNFAEFSLVTKMVKKPSQVIDFLYKLAKLTKPKALLEYKQLQKFAKENYRINNLHPWDILYYSEKLKQHQFNISSEKIREYFPEQQVISGLFKLIKKLFNVSIKEAHNIPVWEKHVKVFALIKNNKTISYFYLDLYARPNKRGGAWMNNFVSRNKLQLPIAIICCNFSKPTTKKPLLLTHEEVITLFHEMGHALQHMLTKINYSDVAGLNGIPWDAVEIVSQFMENWCWQYHAIKLISKHHKTNKVLPEKLFKQMKKTKNFQSGLQMLRQLEFALFDFKLHMQFNNKKNQVQDILDKVRKEIAITIPPAFNRFQNSFTHIFANGYAAGYYSYKWAEVLAADIFAKFLETGLFNRKTCTKFSQTFLEPGGSLDPMLCFKKFRGRVPKIKALLEQDGIAK